MDNTKRVVLESIGCIVLTKQDYLRLIEAEADFLTRRLQRKNEEQNSQMEQSSQPCERESQQQAP